VAVKIKLKRLGKIRNPQYRIVVADARAKRDGRSIEEIGIYQPKFEPSLIEVDSERAQYWLSVGAQPTEPVLVLLKITGDWQKFKGLPGAEGTLRVADAKPDKRAAFDAASKAAAEEPGKEATTPKKRVAPAVKADEVPAKDDAIKAAEAAVAAGPAPQDQSAGTAAQAPESEVAAVELTEPAADAETPEA
jgi:small subunit ribosomal protein S16